MNEAVHGAGESDDVTRILHAGSVSAPGGEMEAMHAARLDAADEERTTILLQPAPDEDERTTILPVAVLPIVAGATDEAAASPRTMFTDSGHQPAAPPAEPPDGNGAEAIAGWPGLLATPVGETRDPASQAPPAPWLSPGQGGPDRPRLAEQETTILAAAEDDHHTMALRLEHPATAAAPRVAPGGAPSAECHHDAGLSGEPAPEPPRLPEADRDGPDHITAPDVRIAQEATASLRAAESPPEVADTTQLLPAAALAGLPDATGGGQVSGRAWFDRRLRDFNHALLHTQTGDKRPVAERQALAAAARDMIQRVALRDPQHRPADWTDTVLQPDQLLVNTYFVRALIARGGVGEIYRVRHRDLKTEHAIKILLPRYALDPTVLTLMFEEARLLQRVRHEAVVGCQGLLRDADGRPMLVMDYLRGPTLSARLRQGPLGKADLIQLAARLASGLSALHAQGLVHQDLSPDNIILVDDHCAAATIIDFGLARSLDAPENTHRNIDFAGKFSWCSPEQLSNRATPVDARSDLYSLGLVLAAAARGTRLDMGSDLATARAARQQLPPLEGIEEPIATLLRHLLAPSASARLGSAAAVPDRLSLKQPGLMLRLFGSRKPARA